MRIVPQLRWRVGSSVIAREARRNRQRVRAAVNCMRETTIDDERLIAAGVVVFCASVIAMGYGLWCAAPHTLLYTRRSQHMCRASRCFQSQNEHLEHVHQRHDCRAHSAWPTEINLPCAHDQEAMAAGRRRCWRRQSAGCDATVQEEQEEEEVTGLRGTESGNSQRP